MISPSQLKYFCVFLYLSSAIGQNDVNDQCRTRDGVNGICRLESDCLEAIRAHRVTGVRPTLCGFSGRVPILCCTEAHMSSNNNNNNNNRPITIRPDNNRQQSGNMESNRNHDEMCMRHCRQTRQATTTTERPPFVGVVGGIDTGVGEFPHMAAIGYEDSSGSLQFQCGGTLISDYYVVTAAHCALLRDLGAPKMVRFGDHALERADDGAKPEDIPVQSITVHPEYRVPSRYHDIALIRLARAVEFTSSIRPACLWRRQQIDSTSAVATGWGRLVYGGERPTALQKVDLEIIEQSRCAALPALAPTSPRGGLLRGLISQQLCAGDLINGGKDTCQGDSGGPLQIKDSENSCIYHLIGVTSFGKGCGGAQSPGIYTRVSSYENWIRSIVWS